MFEGVHNGSRVCIKRIHVYTGEDPKKVAKVCHRHCNMPHSPSLTKLTDLLSRSCNVEIPDAPKYPTPLRCHPHPFPAHINLDAWWGSTGIHQKAPRCRSNWTRRYPSYRVYPALTLVARCPMSLRASTIFTPATWSMGTSREYVVVLHLLLYCINTRPAQHPHGRLRQCTHRGFWSGYSHSELGFHPKCPMSAWSHCTMDRTRALERWDIYQGSRHFRLRDGHDRGVSQGDSFCVEFSPISICINIGIRWRNSFQRHFKHHGYAGHNAREASAAANAPDLRR